MPSAGEAAPAGLAAVLTMRRPQVEAMAQAWLLAGARAFGITSHGRVLAAWPGPEAQPAAQIEPGALGGLAAEVTADGWLLGELRVTGMAGAVAAARLAADATLLAQLAQQERELDAVAEELVGAQDQILALYDLARAARSHLNLPETLSAPACETARLVATDGAAVLFVPDDGEPAWGWHGPGVPELATLLAAFRRLPADGRELILAGSEASHGCNLLLIPVHVRQHTAAALALARGPGCTAFASPEIKLAHAIAEQSGAQIENVLLYEETLARARLDTEMALARTVQMRLLPARAPAITGLQLAGRATPALQVGGDFYDFMPAQAGRTCTFAVGDVSGKGLSAALVMAMARSVLRSKASGGATPAQMLDSANAELYDDLTEVAMFATVFVGQYDPVARTLRYANAGHSPVIYCPPDGPARLLEADGTALGVLPFSLCQDHELPFGPAALLVIGTDGFSEASNAAGAMYGYERLLRLVESLAVQPAAAIADEIYLAVGAFAAGQLQADDQTLIVAKGVLS